jgi:hypothetical protein
MNGNWPADVRLASKMVVLEEGAACELAPGAACGRPRRSSSKIVWQYTCLRQGTNFVSLILRNGGRRSESLVTNVLT